MPGNIDWEELSTTLGYNSEYQMWHDLYVTNSFSVNVIAKKLGCSAPTVSNRLKKYTISARRRGGPNNTAKIRTKLHLMDQRLIFCQTSKAIARMLRINYGTVWKYKNFKGGQQ